VSELLDIEVVRGLRIIVLAARLVWFGGLRVFVEVSAGSVMFNEEVPRAAVRVGMATAGTISRGELRA
jgi:hypothetical protein